MDYLQNHTNEQSGFTAENGYIPESKNNSVDTQNTMTLRSTHQTAEKCFTKGYNKKAQPYYPKYL